MVLREYHGRSSNMNDHGNCQAFELEFGQTFQWQNDIYRIEKYPDGTIPDKIPVTRVAGLWLKEANPWLEHDTWLPVNIQRVENFNPYANVRLVKIKNVVEAGYCVKLKHSSVHTSHSE